MDGVAPLPGESQPGDGVGDNAESRKPNEKALLARIWGNFDSRYMKPLLTHSRPTLLDTLPIFCGPVARLLTTTEQLTQVRIARGEGVEDVYERRITPRLL